MTPTAAPPTSTPGAYAPGSPTPTPAPPRPGKTVNTGWSKYRWTIPAYRKLYETGLFNDLKTMLLDGEVYTMVMPNPPHDYGLTAAFQYVIAVCPSGHYVRNQQGLDVGDRNDPSPDLAVVPGTFEDYEFTTPTTAAWVVEVSDTTVFEDMTVKAEKYATAGIPDYWVVDVKNRRLVVYRKPEPLPEGLGATAYRSREEYGPDESVAPLVAPDRPVQVGELLPRPVKPAGG